MIAKKCVVKCRQWKSYEQGYVCCLLEPMSIKNFSIDKSTCSNLNINGDNIKPFSWLSGFLSWRYIFPKALYFIKYILKPKCEKKIIQNFIFLKIFLKKAHTKYVCKFGYCFRTVYFEHKNTPCQVKLNYLKILILNSLQHVLRMTQMYHLILLLTK